MSIALAIARFTWLALAGSLYLVAYGLGRVRTLLVRDSALRELAVARLRGRVLRRALSRFGATFIKLGQVMSTRRDLFPPAMIDELRKLQDALPPFPLAEVEKTLRADFGRGAAELYEDLEATPVAAASVAQVHRGRLRSGEIVAVKVLRPDIRAKVLRDASMLRFVARALALHPQARLSDPVGHMDELVAGILDQTDLHLEAENNRLFQEHFKGVEGIVFPQMFPELCSERVLTMTFLEGQKVDALPAGDHRALADRLAHAFLKMCYEDGFLHADLHPGNFVVMGDGRVAIFDLGLAKHLPDDVLTEFVDFTRCVVIGNAAEMLQHMKTFHRYMDGVDWDALGKEIEVLNSKFHGRTKAELEMGELFDDMFALARKYRVRPRTELTLIIVGMITAEGVGKMLDPDVDTFDQTAQYLLPLIARRGLGRSGRAGSTT